MKNFVQFLVQKLVMAKHTTYPKIGYRGFMDFEIVGDSPRGPL
jgi:hypothetical protein